VSLNRSGKKEKEFNTENTETAESTEKKRTEKKRTGEGRGDAEKRQRGGKLRLP
jgi:hypothetical protein